MSEKMRGKKRYILLGLLALEIASLPAAAQVMHKVAFDIPPSVSSVEIPTAELGRKRFLVVSNDGFTVQAQDMVGALSVSVRRSGEISGNRFGDNAQLPGDAENCVMMINPARTPVYIADKKTAQSRGSVVSQAVVFEFNFDPSATPQITFSTDAAPAPQASACGASLS